MSIALLRLIPTMQANALLANNYKFLNKKKKRTKDFVRVGIENIVGVSLTKEAANFIG